MIIGVGISLYIYPYGTSQIAPCGPQALQDLENDHAVDAGQTVHVADGSNGRGNAVRKQYDDDPRGS